VSSLSPLSAFESRYRTEEELKEVFLWIMSQMDSRLPTLIDEATQLCHLLRRISTILDDIKGLTLGELKETPEMSVLAELWEKLTRPDDYVKHVSHRTLLNDITMYYLTALEVMKDNLHVLSRMRSDLSQIGNFQAMSASVWGDIPLDMTIDMIKEGMKSLKTGLRRLDGMEADEGNGPLHAAIGA
jgi:hypothetical protein